VLIGLLFYHLFLLISLREANYLFFVILLASLVFEVAVYDGYWRLFVIPNLELLHTYFHQVSFPMLIASILLFSDSFLELKTRHPIHHRAHLIITAAWGALLLLIPFTSYHFIARLMVPSAIISLLVVLIAGFISWKGGFQPARFFMIAWFGMVVSLIIVILVRLGLISSTFFSENVYRLGFVWMAVCWSIALADRINLLKAETESANRDLRNSEGRLSQILEGLPLGVILYGKDQKPKYANQRIFDIFSNPAKGIRPDLSVRRTLAQAIPYFSLRTASDHQEYPLEHFPVYSALQGEPASADDIEMERGDERVALEIQASPVRDDAGNVESAVVAVLDVTQRKQAEAELVEYRKHLEALVEKRTAELSAVNEQLQLRLEWLSAVNLVNQIMARSADFTEIYAKIIEIINQLFATQDSFIAELDAGGNQLKILAHSCQSENHPALRGSVTTLHESILPGSKLEQGKLAVITGDRLSSISGPIGIHIQITGIQGIALVPLQLREQVFGFLGLEWSEAERTITKDEYDLLSIFSIDIAQLIEDRRLYEQAKALITAEERNRLARDLHDSVTQVLFSVTLLAEVLPQIWRRDPELGLQKLDKLRLLTRGALAEMRTMLLELRPSAVINTPLSDLLVQLSAAVTSRSGLSFQLFIEQIPPLPENVHINFYRTAQEALNNVVKHAQANQVTMRLSATPLASGSTGEARHEVKLVIQDDGVGYSSADTGSEHMGIGIMRDRAAAIQASLSLESQPGYGTQVTLIWLGETGSLP
jgi:signal transduction histidine kinase